MTKQPQSASTLKLSKLCRWILILGTFKVLLLGSMFIFPEPEVTTVAKKEASSQNKPQIDRNESSEKSISDVVTDTLKVESPLAYAQPSSSVNVAPPAPKIRQSSSPFTQDVEEKENSNISDTTLPIMIPKVDPNNPSTRPDEAVSATAPVPKLNPFVPKDSLQRKQEELNRREQELLALQQQMQSRLDELHALEGKIQKMLDEANNVKDQKLTHLIDVYSNMKAKQAADVLATLDPKIAVKILSGMRGRQAGEVLTYMAPEPAAKLSEMLSRTQLPN